MASTQSSTSSPSGNGHHSHALPLSVSGIFITLGIVFGDIGTSPLYVMKAVIGAEKISEDLVLGAVSCVFWTLTILATLKYVWLALNADNRGEGGIFALYALVRKYTGTRKATQIEHDAKIKIPWIVIPAILGCASLIADGFLTPPISISSAVEGLRLLPDYKEINTVPIVITILIILFVFQQVGTQIVGKTFGPIMLLWFGVLAWLGLHHIGSYPSVLKALNPWYAINLVVNYKGVITGTHGFWLLGGVFLCTTGGEALYSDLGHCGKQNIRASWSFVFVALLLNYFGQAAWMLSKHNGNPLPEVVQKNGVFYALVNPEYLWIVISIASAATIIASQALITGCFTLVNEAMKLKLWINMKVNYPSQLRGQIYIPAINWFLLMGCIAVVLIFRESGNMEAAYGVAIMINMIMTSILLVHHLRMKNLHNRKRTHNIFLRLEVVIWLLAFILLIVEGAFFVSNMSKFSHGGYFSLFLALGIFSVLYLFFTAKELRKKYTQFDDMEKWKQPIIDLMNDNSIPYEATNLVFLTLSDRETRIDKNIIYSIFKKRPKRADMYWFVHVDITDIPNLTEYRVKSIIPQKVFYVNLRFGFKEEHKVHTMFNAIVQQLQESGEVNEMSHYDSLRKHGIPADFRYIILNSRVSIDDELSPWYQFVIRAYRLIKKLALSSAEDFGLEMSNVKEETVPINLKKKKEFNMRRVESGNKPNSN